MKYEVGDKVRVRRDLNTVNIYGGVHANPEMVEKEIVTIASVNSCYCKIEEDNFCWTPEMFEGLVEEELTAEEAIRLNAEICGSSCRECKLSADNNNTGATCREFSLEHPEQVVEFLKQWKKDHEKKPIETEYVWYAQIIEADTHLLKHEELLETDFSIPMGKKEEEILKKYCSEHDGKYYAIREMRCVVKE